MKKPFYISLCCLLFVSILTEANTYIDQNRVDSLHKRLKGETDNNILAKVYWDFADEYYYELPDSSLFYTSKYLVAALEENHLEWIADAYYWMSDLYYYTNLDSSLFYCLKYLEASKIHGDSSWIADAYFWLGDLYYQFGNIEEAIENYKASLEHYLLLDDSYHIGACYNNIGYTISYGSDQPMGLSYFFKAMEIAETNGDTSLISDVSTNIAYYYERIKDYSTAHFYYNRSLVLELSLKDSTDIASAYAGLASINITMKCLDDAENQLKASKTFLSGQHTPYFMAELYSMFVDCYLDLNNVDSAQLYLEKAEERMNKYTSPFLVAGLQQQKGFLAFLKKDYLSCIFYLDKSISSFKKLNSLESFPISYAKKADAYSALNMFKKAYGAQMYSNAINDSLKYNVIAGMLSKLEQERLFKIKEDVTRLETELATQMLENSNIRAKANLKLAIVVILLLLILISIVIYFLISHRNKNATLKAKNDFIDSQRLELKELNATKDKFFSIIAHDLRNPLSGIIGLSDLYLENPKNLHSERMMPIMESMNTSANYGFTLLENLLTWARSQTGVIQAKPKKIDLEKTLESLKADFDATANKKNIVIEFPEEKSPPIFADENMLSTVLRNLIHNSIKFSYMNGVIFINTYKKDNNLIICIEDQGIGISKEEQTGLFALDNKVRKNGTNNEQGSGLGLILCREFVEKNGGKIWAEGEEKRGSKFCFTLPLFIEN